MKLGLTAFVNFEINSFTTLKFIFSVAVDQLVNCPRGVRPRARRHSVSVCQVMAMAIILAMAMAVMMVQWQWQL